MIPLDEAFVEGALECHADRFLVAVCLSTVCAKGERRGKCTHASPGCDKCLAERKGGYVTRVGRTKEAIASAEGGLHDSPYFTRSQLPGAQP